MEAKKPRDSITKMEQVVLASHANGQEDFWRTAHVLA